MVSALILSVVGIVTAPILIENAKVTSISPPSCTSGYFACYDRIAVMGPANKEIDLFSLRLSEGKQVPSAGNVCVVRFHLQRSGGISDRPPSDGIWRVIDELTCGGRPYPQER